MMCLRTVADPWLRRGALQGVDGMTREGGNGRKNPMCNRTYELYPCRRQIMDKDS